MFRRAAYAFATVALLMATVASSRAQQVDFDHVIAVTGSQATASQVMAKEVLLIALDIDRAAHLESLEDRYGVFGRTLVGLRDGDEMLELPAASNPAIVAELERAEAHWQLVQAVLDEGLAAGSITAQQVDVIAANSTELLAALEAVAGGYLQEANHNRLTSMLANAVLEAGQGTMLSQRMACEFLLIVYGHNVEANRVVLGGSIARFEQVLSNLSNGNLEQRLLPPPNDEIRERLLRAQRVWEDEFRPIIRRALDAGEPSPELAVRMVDANGALFEHLMAVASLYSQL